MVLLVFNLAGGGFQKITVMGTEITFTRFGVLTAGAWVVWAYFLLRFYQFVQVISDRGIVSAVRARMLAYARAHTKLESMQDSIGQPIHYHVEPRGFGRWRIAADVYSAGTTALGHVIVDDQIGFWRGLWWFMRASTVITARTPLVTNFVLPYFVAAAAPIVTLGFWAHSKGWL